MVLACLPSLKFSGVWEYASTGPAGPTLTAKCTDSSAGMPDLSNVALLQATGGGTATWLAPGIPFLVAFANQDPSRPVVVSGPPGGIPATTTVDASVSVAVGPSAASVALAGGGAPVARVGDAVLVTITIAQGALFVAPPGGGPCVVAAPIPVTGTITSGSLKAVSG